MSFSTWRLYNNSIALSVNAEMIEVSVDTVRLSAHYGLSHADVGI